MSASLGPVYWRSVLTASSQLYQPWTSSPMMNVPAMGCVDVSASSKDYLWRSATNDSTQQPVPWTLSGTSYAAAAASSNVSAPSFIVTSRNFTNDVPGLRRFQATTERQCGDRDQSTDFRQATSYGHCCSIDIDSSERRQPDQAEGRKKRVGDHIVGGTTLLACSGGVGG